MSWSRFLVALALLSACNLPGAPEQREQPASEAVTEARAVDEAALADLQMQRTGVRIREVGPGGAIPRQVVIRIAGDVFPSDLVGGEAPASTQLEIEPKVPGTLEVSARDTLTFLPEKGFEPDTTYTFTLASVGVEEDLRHPAEPGAWSRTFTTPRFEFLRMSLRERDPRANRVTAELVFSGPVDAEDVARRTSFALGEGAVTPTMHRAGDEPNTVRFVFTGRNFFQDVPLTATVAEGVAFANDPQVKAVAGSGKVDLAAGQAMEIRAVNVKEGANGFYVDVVCHDEAGGDERYYWDRETWTDYYVSERCLLDPEDAARGMHFDPGVSFTVAAGPVGFRVFGDFERGSYDMSIDAGTRTVDGGMLGSTFETTIQVPERSPKVQFATKGRYLPRSAWENLAIRHVNVEGVEITIRHVPEENLVFWMSGEEPASARTSTVVLKRTVPVRDEPDQEVTSWIDVGAMLPEAGSGVYELKLRGIEPEEEEAEEETTEVERVDTGWWPHETEEEQEKETGPTDFSRLLITDMQLVAKLAAPGPDQEWTPSAEVWAFNTHDNSPVTGADVEMVRPSGQVIGTCRTDFSGGCTLEVEQDPLDDTAPLAIVVRRGDDLTYLKFADLQVPPPADVHGVPYLDEQPYRAAVYTDRGVYRPGDTAHVTAILRKEDHSAPQPNLPVVAKLFDPKRKELRKKVLQANPAGMVSMDLPFADFATTGKYRVALEVGEKQVGETTFNVEEFVPERMKVEASIDGEYLADDPVPVDIAARWLFGGSAGGSEVELTCQLVPGAFTPEKNKSFHYGLADIEDGTDRRVVSLGSLSDRLDDEGQVTLNCPAAARSGGFLGAATLVAQAAVFEGDSGRTTLGEAKAPVHPEAYYLGLSTPATKVRPGDELNVSGLVVDWSGEVFPSVSKVVVELVRLEEEYLYTWDSDEQRYRYRRLLRRSQEDTAEAAVRDGRFALTLHPAMSAAGYLVVARSGDARTELFVEGSGRRYWWQPSETAVDQTPRPNKPGELTLEAPEVVQVGDKVTVKVTAPYAGRMLFSAETHEVIEDRWTDVEAGEVEWSFKVREFVPNIYVSALLVKDPHLESAEAFLPDRAYGVRSVRIQPAEYTHDLALSVPAEVRPHSKLTVGVDLGPLEEPTYVTVAAVDEGILSLTKFQSPNPFDSIFARRELGVDTYETVGWTLLVPPGGPGSHTGGDADSGGGGRVQMVKPVALWSGIVEVPRSGKATVSFDVPGYRGELRVMAVSAGTKRMGHADQPVTVRDPIVVQTTLPRFLIEGDEAVLPVFVSNVSGKARDITVALAVQDLALPGDAALTALVERPSPVEVVGEAQSPLHLEDGASDTVLFRVRATSAPDAAKFKVTATAGSLVSFEEIELPIARGESESRDTVKLALVKGDNDLGPALDGWIEGTDRTRIWVTTNPYGEALSHVRALVHYPYGCIEQTTSSTRPLLYVSTLLDAVDPELAKEAPVEKMVQYGIERILSMQTPTGGFAYWPGGYAPNPWGTAYATHLLLDAKEAGFPVPSRPLEDALDYLEREADTRVGTYEGDNTTAYVQFVLARGGRGRTAQAEGLLAQLGEGQRTGRGYHEIAEPRYLLMAAMYLGGDRRYESQLKSPDTSQLTNERKNDWSFWSDLRSRGFQLSVYYDLFGATGSEGQALANVVGNGLAQHRSTWYTTQEMAWGLTGLGKWVSGGLSDIGEPTLTVSGRTIEAHSVGGKQGTDYVWTLSGATGAGSVNLDLPKTGGRTVYAVVSVQGVRAEGAPVGNNGLALTREILAADGRPFDLARHQLGDPVFVRIGITNISGSTVQNIALVDRIPAGWEIENPRLGRGHAVDWIDPSQTWDVEYMNLRDDRVEVFGTLQNREKRYVIYQVRAVTGGTFTHPAVSAEAMYDPRIWARLHKGKVTIRDPWSGT